MKKSAPYPHRLFTQADEKEREKIILYKRAKRYYQAKCLAVQEGKLTEATEYYEKCVRCMRYASNEGIDNQCLSKSLKK